MKEIIIIACLVMFTGALHAQKNGNGKNKIEKRTLLKNSPLTGGFLGLTMKNGEINNQGALWVGGEFGAIFGRDLGIGLAGYGLVNSVKSANTLSNGESLYYQSGYGGLFIEPAMLENRTLSLSFPTVLGAGGITQTRSRGLIDELDNFDLDEGDINQGDAFWVVEPGAQINLNVTRWMKINAGVNYRWVYGLDLPQTNESSLSGWQGNVSLRLGWF